MAKAKVNSKPPLEMPLLSFENPTAWRKWLRANHATSDGVWLKFAKKGADFKTVNYKQALDEALCYGWIDSQAKTLDSASYKQKFTPRRPRSIWSKVNITNVQRLIESKKMRAPGLKQINIAKENGTWEKAYDSPSKSTIPADFIKQLKKNKVAYAFFKSLNKANLYAISWRLQTAKKSETREKRMQLIIKMLANEKKYHG